MIISSALLFVYFIQRNQGKSATELSFDKAMTQIRNKDISKILVKQDSLELTNKSNEKFVTKLDASDASRKILLDAADEVNKEKPDSIETNLEQIGRAHV